MKNLKISVLNNFRKYLTDPASRGTEAVNTFAGDGETTTYSLENSPLMFINSVKIDDLEKKLNRDFYLDFGRGDSHASITFVVAPVNESEIKINYVFGNNWIYPGTPQTDNRQLPRIGILRTGGGHRSAGTGEQSDFVDVNLRLSIWVRSGDSFTINNETYTGDKLLDYIENDIVETIVKMKRDYDEPYNVVTIDIQSVFDIPFDEDFKLNRREISLRLLYLKNF